MQSKSFINYNKKRRKILRSGKNMNKIFYFIFLILAVGLIRAFVADLLTGVYPILGIALLALLACGYVAKLKR